MCALVLSATYAGFPLAVAFISTVLVICASNLLADVFVVRVSSAGIPTIEIVRWDASGEGAHPRLYIFWRASLEKLMLDLVRFSKEIETVTLTAAAA